MGANLKQNVGFPGVAFSAAFTSSGIAGSICDAVTTTTSGIPKLLETNARFSVSTATSSKAIFNSIAARPRSLTYSMVCKRACQLP